MKPLFTIIMLFFSVNCFAQNQAKAELKIFRGFWGWSFAERNYPIGVKEARFQMRELPEAMNQMNQMNKFRRRNITTKVIHWLGMTPIISIVGIRLLANKNKNSIKQEQINIIQGGAFLLITAIPIRFSARAKAKKAVRIYNNSLYQQ